MIAAQLYDSIEKELGTEALKGLIREGKFGAIREWLRSKCIYTNSYIHTFMYTIYTLYIHLHTAHIHKVGSLYDTPDELLSKVIEGSKLHALYYGRFTIIDTLYFIVVCL